MNVKAFRAIQLILLGSAIASAAVLKQETLQVWNDYTGTVNTQMEERASGAMPF